MAKVCEIFLYITCLFGGACADLFPCTGCYCDPTYDIKDLQVKNDTVFGRAFNVMTSKNETLLLNSYDTPASDKRKRRPVMIVVHGGGFSFNTKDTDRYVAIAKYFAAHGFFALSINYRLEFDPKLFPCKGADTPCDQNFSAANLDATHDTRAAVRWLVKNSEKLRIDPHRIAAVGGSAGGCVSAELVAVPGEGVSGNPGYPSNVTAAISVSGILVHLARGNVTKDEPPFLDFQGTADPGVPYQWAIDTKNAMDKVGARNDLVLLPGQSHVPFQDVFGSNHTHDVMGWLTKYMDLTATECPPRPALVV